MSRSVKFLVLIFGVSGVVHLVRPEVYEPLMPAWVPKHREVILASGVAELACAAGLAVPATRRTAGWASALLLLGVFPGNVKMAVDAAGTDNTGLQGRRLRPAPAPGPDDPLGPPRRPRLRFSTGCPWAVSLRARPGNDRPHDRYSGGHRRRCRSARGQRLL